MKKRSYRLFSMLAVTLVAGAAAMLAPPWHSAKANPKIAVYNDCYNDFPTDVKGPDYNKFHPIGSVSDKETDHWTFSGVSSGKRYKISFIGQIAPSGPKTVNFSGSDQKASLACVYMIRDNQGACSTMQITYTSSGTCPATP